MKKKIVTSHYKNKKVVKKRLLKQKVNEYSELMISAIKRLDTQSLDRIANFIWEAYIKEKTIFFAGNGGSASTASHMAADLGKNTVRDHKDKRENRMRTMSMCDNAAWITAVSNDTSYDDIFVEQLKSYAKAGDVLFVISGSGNSMNVIKAAIWAREHKIHSIGVLGFDGGYIKNFLDLTLIVGSRDYGIVESMHSYIHHFLVEKLKWRKKEENV